MRIGRLAAVCFALVSSLSPSGGEASRPNIGVIMTDDQTVEQPHADEPQTFALSPGEPAFWTGDLGMIYGLDVGEGWRLRVGIDHATVGDVFTATLTDPSGASSSFTPGSGLYSAEDIVSLPAPGMWTLRVEAPGARDPRFRLRALLEQLPAEHEGDPVQVLPNLQALPPYQLAFVTPISNGLLGGAPMGEQLPGGRVTCHPEEVIEEGAVRCLRMTFGVRNTGDGPMQLHYPGGAPLDRVLFQRIRITDGSFVDREAGRAVYHKTHAHYHHDQAVGLQLFAVDADGELVAAGAEHRKGFAHRDELLREWWRFYPRWPSFGFGLAAGWGDYYEWDRPGNYIDFGFNGDGDYVLRMSADPVGGILESNEQDNASYTYFRVAGEDVEVLETGRGRDPWDPCKIVMPIGAEPDGGPPDLAARPSWCPPDTI